MYSSTVVQVEYRVQARECLGLTSISVQQYRTVQDRYGQVLVGKPYNRVQGTGRVQVKYGFPLVKVMELSRGNN